MNTILLLAALLGQSPFLVPPPTGGPFQLTATSTQMGIAPPNKTDDTNGRPLTIHPSNVAANATAARTAGDLVLAGGLDSKTVVFTPAGANPDTGGNCTIADTVTVTVNGTANVFTYTTYCGGGCATRNAAATALAGAIDAVAGVGATVGTITGGVADAVLITADQPATVSVLLAQNDASCTAISGGTDGLVAIAPGSTSQQCLHIGRTYLCDSPYGVVGSLSWGNAAGSVSGPAYAGQIQGNSMVSTYAMDVIGTGSDAGSNGFRVGVIANKGDFFRTIGKTTTLTFSAGGDATKTWAGAIPKGAINVQCSGWNMVAESGGGCTSYSAGNAAAPFSNAAVFGTLLPLTLDASWSPSLGNAMAAPPSCYGASDCDIVLTSTGVGCKNLSVRLICDYMILNGTTIR